MINEIWLNIPVKDPQRSREFFEAIGFKFTSERAGGQMMCFEVGAKPTTVLFVGEELFRSFARTDVGETKAGCQILYSFGAESREEVDETARLVFEAGGTIFGAPGEIQGWMYGFGFCDPDGHRWNQVFMDLGKMPQS